jgi:hypothetical protein
LEGVDELRVETRGHLNAHAAQEEPEIHDTHVWLLVPWHLVLSHQAGEDRVGSPIFVRKDTHLVEVRRSFKGPFERGSGWKLVESDDGLEFELIHVL